MNFKELFQKIDGEEYPQKREYKGKTIFLLDRFPVLNGEKLIISIEKTGKNHPQGLGLSIYGSCKFLGKRYKKGKLIFMRFWEDAEGYDPKHIEVQIFTKRGYITIENVWETEVDGFWGARVHPSGKYEHGFIKYDHPKKEACFVSSMIWRQGYGNGAAMYSEDIPNGKRYFCNDGEEDDDFDDIIFTVRRVSI